MSYKTPFSTGVFHFKEHAFIAYFHPFVNFLPIPHRFAINSPLLRIRAIASAQPRYALCVTRYANPTMAKKVKTLIKVQIIGGKATPAPPLGPVLGQHGMNIAEFCTKVNAETQDRAGEVVPVVITLYEDRSYDFITKTAPAASLLMKAAGVKKGSGKPLTEKIGKVTKSQIREIAEKKLPDLNTANIESAMKQIGGTARNMGIEVI